MLLYTQQKIEVVIRLSYRQPSSLIIIEVLINLGARNLLTGVAMLGQDNANLQDKKIPGPL